MASNFVKVDFDYPVSKLNAAIKRNDAILKKVSIDNSVLDGSKDMFLIYKTNAKNFDVFSILLAKGISVNDSIVSFSNGGIILYMHNAAFTPPQSNKINIYASEFNSLCYEPKDTGLIHKLESAFEQGYKLSKLN